MPITRISLRNLCVETPYYLQIVQDTIAFRANVPLWSITPREMPKDFRQAISDLPEDPISAMTMIAGDIRYWNDIIQHSQVSNWKTATSNYDPLSALLDRFKPWQIWRLTSLSREAIALSLDLHKLGSQSCIKACKFNHPDEERSSSPTRQSVSMFYTVTSVNLPPSKGLLFAGPWLDLHQKPDTQREVLVVAEHLASIFRLLFRRLTPDSPLVDRLSYKQILRAAAQRHPPTQIDALRRVDRAAQSIARVMATDIDLRALNCLPVEYLTGLSGAIYFSEFNKEGLNLHAEDVQIEMPRTVDDQQNPIKSAWVTIPISNDEKPAILSDSISDMPSYRKGRTNRLRLTKDGELLDGKNLDYWDQKLSQSLTAIRTRKSNFFLEQLRLLRVALQDSRGSLQGVDDSRMEHYDEVAAGLDATSHRRRWPHRDLALGLEKPPHSGEGRPHLGDSAIFSYIASVCFVLFRTDLVGLYSFREFDNRLVKIGIASNPRKSRKTSDRDRPIPDAINLDGLDQGRLDESIAYRCVKWAMMNHSADVVLNPTLSIKEGRQRTAQGRRKVLYAPEYEAASESEMAVPLNIYGRAWGVLLIGGYLPHQFEVAARQNLQALGRLLSHFLFNTLLDNGMLSLNRIALLQSDPELDAQLPHLAVSEETVESAYGGHYRGQHLGTTIRAQMAAVSDAVGLRPEDRLCAAVCRMLFLRCATLWKRKTETSSVYVCSGWFNRSDLDFLESEKDPFLSQFFPDGHIYEATCFQNDRPVLGEKVKLIDLPKISRDFLAVRDLAGHITNRQYAFPLRGQRGEIIAVLSFFTAYQTDSRWHDLYRFVAAYLSVLIHTLHEAERRSQRRIEYAAHTIEADLRKLESAVDSLTSEFSRHVLQTPKAGRLLEDLTALNRSLTLNVAAITEPAASIVPPSLLRKPLSVPVTLRDTLYRVTIRLDVHSVSGRDQIPKQFGVWISQEALDAILTNLFDNAKKYCPSGFPIDVRWAFTKDGATLTVHNYGPKLEQFEKDNRLIFLPDYRGRSAEKDTTDAPGKGLGLAYVQAICSEWGAIIEHSTSPLSGEISRTKIIRNDAEELLTIISDPTSRAIEEGVRRHIADDHEKHHFTLLFPIRLCEEHASYG